MPKSKLNLLPLLHEMDSLAFIGSRKVRGLKLEEDTGGLGKLRGLNLEEDTGGISREKGLVLQSISSAPISKD